MRLLEFDERSVGVRAEDVGLIARRARACGCDREAVAVEPLLKCTDVRSFIPQLAIERKLV